MQNANHFNDVSRKFNNNIIGCGICIVLIPSIKLSVDGTLCRDSLVKALRVLVKCLESW